MLWPKKHSHKELGNERKFLQLENSPAPLKAVRVLDDHVENAVPSPVGDV